MIEKSKYIWMDGKLVKWDDAKVHILTHSLHYGLAIFEGIRCYKSSTNGLNAFRLKDHIKRLLNGCKIANFELKYSFNDLVDACKQTVLENNIGECYIRPLIYLGYGSMGVHPGDTPVRTSIAVWKWGKYLGKGALEKGVSIKTSSFNRYHPNAVMTRGKITGSYAAGVLAKMESVRQGYHEAVLLDQQGFIAEGTGENIFIVRDGKIKTTPLTVILPGITRETIIKIAKDLGYEVEEERFTKDEVYIADEAFFTGTASEVTPITKLDDRNIGTGKPGPITRKIQEVFFNTVKGKEKRYEHWLDPISIRGGKANKKKKKLAVISE